MRSMYRVLAVTALGASLIGPTTFAQDHGDDHHPAGYVEHNEWKRGYHLKSDDWSRAQPIDYKQYHLKAPPHGYEWRSVDGHYVLANSSGVISTVVVAR